MCMGKAKKTNYFRHAVCILVHERQRSHIAIQSFKEISTVVLIYQLVLGNSRCRISLLHLLVNDLGLQDSDLLLVAGGHLEQR